MAVTTPDPHAAGSPRFSQWWVVTTQSTFHGPPATTKIVQATSRPAGTIAGPFSSQSAAQQWLSQQGAGLPFGINPLGWLSSLGGMIGSGIEAGFVNIIKDLWNVIIGPLEVLLGILIAMWVLVIYFKSDIINLAGALHG